MALRNEVFEVLNALCEGTGVKEGEDGDFSVDLSDRRIWVRVIEEPGAIYVYRTVANEVPRTPEVDEFLHDVSKGYVVFRVLWEEEAIFLRADLAATPFVPRQLQRILDDFDGVADEVTPLAQEWSTLA